MAVREDNFCPIWGKEGDDREDKVAFVNIRTEKGDLYSSYVYSPRAGGIFQADRLNLTKKYLQKLTPREKANLSYRIYRHNWNLGLLRPRDPQRRGDVCLGTLAGSASTDHILQVTEDAGTGGLLDQPPAEERLLSFVREWLWQQDHNQSDSRFLKAAAACATMSDYVEFKDAIRRNKWILQTGTIPDLQNIHFLEPHIVPLNLEARLWIEKQEREQGVGKQGFVAMSFDASLNSVYEHGFRLAIKAAGYEPHRIDDDPNHSDNLVDRILAAIRQSRFVVADFTCNAVQDEQGHTIYLDCGGVYYEAGFAYGKGIPVIYTCHQNVVDKLHFDIRQLNHLLWENKPDLARKLQARIERQFGRGPGVPHSAHREERHNE